MEWLGSTSDILSTNGVNTSLSYLCRREFTIECNWKVFCDNYLDGGYHVPFAHKDLASGLKLDSYSTKICMFHLTYILIKMYRPWMNTNLVLPLGPRRWKVTFDYFLDASLKDDEAFVTGSLKDSEQVQMEDVTLCESVQRVLESPAYGSGRYTPMVEKAMHHFHCLLHQDLIN
uniref:Choline monooxygenase, chloroplastic n=1 Tax=Lactuca sativa TaxID=4236 RepID=A0A9R1VL71_LACSA|nr:hypothetical protein LSAT_V11C500240020 [Lactuca sativa]